MSVRILIANEHPRVRKLLRDFVARDSRWEICGEAVDGGDAVSKAHQLFPELIILGLGMPVLNGIEAAREIAKFLPEAMMLLCASQLTTEQREQALQAGIRGVLAKTRLGSLPEAVEALLRRETFFNIRTQASTENRLSPEDRNPAMPSTAEPRSVPLTVRSLSVPDKIFFCEAVKDGSLPTRGELLIDPDPLVCTQCSRTYNLHYSSLARPVLLQLSRLLATDVIESEHPKHSARVSVELTPSNAVN